jgi:hypothetical protein
MISCVKNDKIFNKYKAKMEANTFFDLYTISEIFSQYQEIAQSWKQTGKLAYKLTSNIHQNCQLAISRKEFYEYLLSLWAQCNDAPCPVLFSMYNNNNDIVAIEYRYNESFFNGMNGITRNPFPITRYEVALGDISYRGKNSDFHFDIPKILHGRKGQVEYFLEHIPESFRDVSQMVFFDIVTTHNILKLRETCYNVVPNYAKVKALEQFNKNFEFLLNKNLSFCGFYVTINALRLGVDTPKIMENDRDSVEHLREVALKIINIINSW